MLTRPESLQEHLLRQLRLQRISEEEFRVGELLIRNLDDNGFHITPSETLVAGKDLQVLNYMKEMIQGFDPMGTCTADYRESLLVQVKNHPHSYPGSFEVVENYLELLEKEKFNIIARRIKKSVQDVQKIRAFIRELDPLPGRNFSTEPPRYVIPDLMVKMKDGEFVIILNNEEIPTLGVNPFFTIISDDKDRYKEKKLKRFVNSSLQDARWFIRSINQRNDTMLKVCKSIIEFQRGFFRKGPKYLIPLVLKDIAGEIGVHEATVSRATNGKYIQTEWGIFELKYFFSNSVSGTSPGGNRFSKQGVKEMIREIIEGDDSQKHLTDQRITEILANKGVKLARRTVAKYRKELAIMSSYHR
ncbi:RNA polymerase sigma-54 factor [subsurface metagenome]